MLAFYKLHAEDKLTYTTFAAVAGLDDPITKAMELCKIHYSIKLFNNDNDLLIHYSDEIDKHKNPNDFVSALKNLRYFRLLTLQNSDLLKRHPIPHHVTLALLAIENTSLLMNANTAQTTFEAIVNNRSLVLYEALNKMCKADLLNLNDATTEINFNGLIESSPIFFGSDEAIDIWRARFPSGTLTKEKWESLVSIAADNKQNPQSGVRMFVAFVKKEIFGIEPLEQQQTNAALEPSLGAIEFFKPKSKLSSASKYVHLQHQSTV